MYERDRSNVNGILLVKRLIKVNPEDNKSVREIRGATIKPPSCSTDTPLFDILNMFQMGKSKFLILQIFVIFKASVNLFDACGYHDNSIIFVFVCLFTL